MRDRHSAGPTFTHVHAFRTFHYDFPSLDAAVLAYFPIFLVDARIKTAAQAGDVNKTKEMVT